MGLAGSLPEDPGLGLFGGVGSGGGRNGFEIRWLVGKEGCATAVGGEEEDLAVGDGKPFGTAFAGEGAHFAAGSAVLDGVLFGVMEERFLVFWGGEPVLVAEVGGGVGGEALDLASLDEVDGVEAA